MSRWILSIFSWNWDKCLLWNFQLRNWKVAIEAKLYLTRDHCHMRHSQRSTQLPQYAWPHSPGMDWWSPRDREDAEWHIWHPTTTPQKRTTRTQFFPHLPTEQTTAAASTMQGIIKNALSSRFGVKNLHLYYNCVGHGQQCLWRPCIHKLDWHWGRVSSLL